MQENKMEKGKQAPSDLIEGLKCAYRLSNAPQRADVTAALTGVTTALYDSLVLEEVLWYALNKGGELPKNREVYIGALSLLSHSKLTEEERRLLVLTLVKVDEVLVKARGQQWLTGIGISIFQVAITIFFLLINQPFLCTLFWVYLYPWAMRFAFEGKLSITRKTCLIHLGLLQVPEAIPFLAQTDRFPVRLRETATKSLYQLLPTLTPAHYRAFSKETVPNLCNLLSHEIRRLSPSKLERATLMVEALEKMGDSRAILTVEALQRELREKQKSFEELQLRAPSATWNRNVYFELQNKVSHLLYVLLERRIQEEQHDTLLRGSSAPVDTSQLLRPITGREAQEPAEQLLRSANREGEP